MKTRCPNSSLHEESGGKEIRERQTNKPQTLFPPAKNSHDENQMNDECPPKRAKGNTDQK